MILFVSPAFGQNEEAGKLAAAARKVGVETDILVDSWSNKPAFEEFRKTGGAVWGSVAFCEFVASEMRWNLHSNSLDWITRISPSFLKRTARMTTLGELRAEQQAHCGILHKAYLEPADERLFPAGIPDYFPNLPRQFPVIAQSPVKWTVKYRFVVINGEVVDGCCYRVGDCSALDAIKANNTVYKGTDSMEFTNLVLKTHQTAPACIIDVGVVDSLGWSVCGTYPVWSSRMLACDPDIFLRALMVACEPIN